MAAQGSTTFWEFVVATAAAHPDRIVVVDDHGRSLTSAQLRDRAEEVAAGLVDLGLESGSVVSWQLPTTLESAVMLVACARLGAVQNPIIPMLRHAEVGHIAGQIGTDLLVIPERWRGFDHAAMAEDLGLRSWTADYETPVDAMTRLRLPLGDASNLPEPPVDAEECRWIYFSSGTTAAPKGVRHTDVSAMASATTLSQRLGFGPDDVYPIAWPFTHIGGIAMLVTSLNTGVRLVLSTCSTLPPLRSGWPRMVRRCWARRSRSSERSSTPSMLPPMVRYSRVCAVVWAVARRSPER